MNRTTSRRTTSHHRELAWRTPAFIAGLTSSLVACMPAGAAHAAPISPASSDRAIAQILVAKSTPGWSLVILKTTGTLTPVQEARLHSLGGDITRRLPIIGSVAVRVPSRSLRQVAALPFVTHVSLDGMVQKSDDFTVGSSEAGQAIAMNSAGKPYQVTGQGVTVAVIDSGVAPTQDLATNGTSLLGSTSRILASVNFAPDATGSGTGYNNGLGLTLNPGTGRGQGIGLTGLGTNLFVGNGNNGSLYDSCGHGTHIAGIIAGNGAKSSGGTCFRTFFGIAPQSSLVNVRVLDNNGQASVATVISGLQWVVSNKSKYNIRVINLSLGHPVSESYTTDPLCQAVEAAWKAGIVVVCAAGNDGRAGTLNDPAQSNEGWGTNYGSIQSPANDPSIITVGATKSMDGVRADDRIATYSSRGPSRIDLVLKPDIIAPGNKVISLCSNNSFLDAYEGGTNDIPQTAYQRGKPTSSSYDYFQLSGTSMAAPVVAGAAALLLQVNSNLSPDTIKARLMLSASKWADPSGDGDALTYGAGYLNIPAALASTAKATLPALSPTLIANSDGTLSLVMDHAAWGSAAVYGSTVTLGSGLWGTGVTDLRAAWGSSVQSDRAAWGSGSTAADRAAWGSNSVSSDRAAWGCSVNSDRAAWGCSTTAVDLTSIAITGE